MENNNIVFIGKQVLLEGELRAARVVVKDGKIVDVVEAGDGDHVSDGVDVIDVGEDILMPGLVDSHVHINEPGRTSWEGFRTASMAAAAGGVTTLVDMPLNSLPPTTTLDNLRVKAEAAVGQCWVNVKFWGGVIPGNTPHLREMVAMGVPGFKCFLIHSGVDEFPAVDRDQVVEALTELRDTGAVLLFHAECEVEEDGGAESGAESGADPDLYSTFLSSRPSSMETAAIQLVVDVCRLTGVPCHIVHLSAASALPLIRAARAEGLQLTVETCHHYLNLSSAEIPPRATQYKCCPPIRDENNQELLWEAVMAGDIDIIVSDHSPCKPDLKLPGKSNIYQLVFLTAEPDRIF